MSGNRFRVDGDRTSASGELTATREGTVARHGPRAWAAKYWGGLALLLLGMVATGVVAAYAQRPAPAPVVVFQSTPRPTPSPPPMTQIVVHVNGAVENPGVYRLPIGARVEDAIKTAGGALPEAELHRLNLAARLADGQQVSVPARSAVSPASASGTGSVVAASPAAAGRVNVNTASIPELDGLPGVGPVTAQRIVAYREQHGPFSRIEQLRETKLVNNATFEKLKDRIVVE